MSTPFEQKIEKQFSALTQESSHLMNKNIIALFMKCDDFPLARCIFIQKNEFQQ